jgi:hypothetical protein
MEKLTNLRLSLLRSITPFNYSIGDIMKPSISLNILAAILITVGIIWGLQGADILQGSAISGVSRWIVIGSAYIMTGIGFLMYNYRQKLNLNKYLDK